MLGTSEDDHWFHRDSGVYVVDHKGYRHVGTGTINDTINSRTGPTVSQYTISKGSLSNETVPAGNFEGYIVELNSYKTDGTPMSPCDNTVVYESFYAPGIGLIKTQQSLYSYVMIECRYHERRLVNYFIAD